MRKNENTYMIQIDKKLRIQNIGLEPNDKIYIMTLENNLYIDIKL